MQSSSSNRHLSFEQQFMLFPPSEL